MSDKEKCGTRAHVFLGNGEEEGPAGWPAVLREASIGMLVMAGLAVVLALLVRPGPGIAVVAITVGIVLLVSAGFLAAGHRVSCAAKKGLVAVFRSWEFVF
ncbi:hypothetical protein ACIA8O_04035 [Kitasatospora sp. NPDC051853]|uniref:hypothetical protein n=1 Tax=Kitasatospora sp. NPDC051853 TaxID=3364058 RepID=UPI0037984812